MASDTPQQNQPPFVTGGCSLEKGSGMARNSLLLQVIETRRLPDTNACAWWLETGS